MKMDNLFSAFLVRFEKMDGSQVLQLSIEVHDPLSSVAVFGRPTLHQAGGIMVMVWAMHRERVLDLQTLNN